MRITLNPTKPQRAKLHMEAAWHAIFYTNAEIYRFRDYAVQVSIDTDGNVETTEINSRAAK